MILSFSFNKKLIKIRLTPTLKANHDWINLEKHILQSKQNNKASLLYNGNHQYLVLYVTGAIAINLVSGSGSSIVFSRIEELTST